MSNGYYNASGTPATSSSGASAPMRSEFTSIAAGFALLPTLSGNGSKAVIVNSGGTALTITTGTLALAGNLATTGAFNTTLVQSASITLTLPGVTGTLATLAGAETLSNKTLVAPALGTPASGVLTNCTGTASGLTAGSVTTNANLTGVITSIGNATSIGAQTGTGTTFVMNTSPTLVTPALGVATATSLAIGGATLGGNGLAVTGHLLLEGVTSTGATGTGNLVFSAAPTFTGTLTAATTSFSGHMTIEGVTSSGATGTGNFVFATGPTVTTLTVSSGGAAVTGAISSTSTVSDSLGSVRSIIHSGSDKTTGYSLLATDNGQYISLGASGAITIPNSTLADGNVVTVFNNTASSATITCNTTTAYIAGTNTNKGGGGTMSLATRGTCTILFLGTTSCVVAGNVS